MVISACPPTQNPFGSGRCCQPANRRAGSSTHFTLALLLIFWLIQAPSACVSLRLLDVAEDIVRSIFRQGFRRLLFLNGHGGNDPVRTRLAEIIDWLPGLQIGWYSWWNAANVTAVATQTWPAIVSCCLDRGIPFHPGRRFPSGEKQPPITPGLLGAKEPANSMGMVFLAGLIRWTRSFSTKFCNTALQGYRELTKLE